MLKVLSLMKRKPGTSYEEFRNWALNEHPKLATQIPGMKGYRMNVPVKENPDIPYDCISEMWWDSDEARLAGFGTDQGKAAG
ncbi:MAG: EthD domain-containing protein, partial [Devosia sp.]